MGKILVLIIFFTSVFLFGEIEFNKASLAYNNGGHKFWSHESILDVDQDGDLDRIRITSCQVVWDEDTDCDNNGDICHVIHEFDNYYIHASVANVTNDGFEDVVICNETSGTIYIYYNDGTGNFNLYRQFETGLSNITNLIIDDINNDNLEDILAADNFTNTIAFCTRNFTDDDFSVNTSLCDFIFKSNRISVQNIQSIADFDNDGDLDIFGSNSAGDSLAWLEFDMNINNFSITHNVAPQTDEYCVPEVIELNGDCFPDIGISMIDEGIRFLLNNSGFGFSDQVILQDSLRDFWHIYFDDFNNDGRDDFVVQKQIGDAWVYKNVTSGSSMSFIHESTLKGFLPVNTYDVNNDGYKDLICSSGNVIYSDNGCFYSCNADLRSLSSVFLNCYKCDDNIISYRGRHIIGGLV